MNYLAAFKSYLETVQKASAATVKNYLSDIRKFQNWIEQKTGETFNPGLVTPEQLEAFKAEMRALSVNSSERYLSSLRKFYAYLEAEKLLSNNPFTLQDASSKPQEKDPFHLKAFKNSLYEVNASEPTIKNYMADIQQFMEWAEEVSLDKHSYIASDSNLFSKLTTELIGEYKMRLHQKAQLSPASINRKLSSIRKYLAFLLNQGVIESVPFVVNTNGHAFSQPTSEEEVAPQAESARAVISDDIPNQTSPVSPKAYSRFGPLRLLQRFIRAGNFTFDLLMILPLVKLIEQAQYLFVKFSGKGVFLAAEAKVASASFTSRTAFKAINGLEGVIENRARKSEVRGIHHFITRDKKTLADFGFRVSNLPKEMYAPISVKNLPFHKKLWHHARFTRPNWYRKYHSYAITHYFHFAILMIVITALGVGGYNGLFNKARQAKILAAAPTAPPRILSFQGRLTDSADNPITATTNLRFAIYNDQSATGSALLWQEVKTTTPDTDGIFNVYLGQGTSIPSSVFSDNASLYLGITVGTNDTELTPRQQIATVAFASNSETLQGLLPITASGATQSNVVLALDSAGNLTIGGSATPTFQASGGQFTLSGTVLRLATTAGSNSDIQLSPDGRGRVDIQKAIFNSTNYSQLPTAAGAVNVDDLFAVNATSSGQSAVTINQDGAGPLISASASGLARFTVDNVGNGFFYGDAEISGGDITSSNTTGTIFNTNMSTLQIGGAATSLTLGASSGTLALRNPSINVGGGSAATIQTTSNTSLTFGGGTTGDIIVAPQNGIAGASIHPNTNNQVDLGTATLAFRNIYVSNIIGASTGINGYWQRSNNALSPTNITDDVLLGSTATSSALIRLGGTTNADSFFNTGGNVGIGTTTTGAKLDVNGNILVQAGGTLDTRAAGTLTIGGATQTGLTLGRSGQSTTLAGNVQAFTLAGNITGVGTPNITGIGQFSGTTAVLSTSVSTPSIITASGNLGITPAGTDTTFGSKNISSIANISSTYLTTSTNVVNVAGASTALQMNGTTTITSSRFFQGANGSASTPSLSFSSDPNTGIFATGADVLGFATNGAEAMRISPNGNVGIGTTNPTSFLDIRGTTNTNNALMKLVQNGNADIFTASNGASTKFVINNTGNIGIGTSTPAQLFDVQGGTGIVGQFSGRVIGGNAVNSNEFITLSQLNASNYWQMNSGAISPFSNTLDVLIGATATTSAKFAFLNNAGIGTPTASASGNIITMPYTNGTNQTGGFIGVGTTAPTALVDINNRSGFNKSTALNITQANTNNADSTAFTITNTANIGTLSSGTRTLSNANFTFSPTATLSQSTGNDALLVVNGLSQTLNVNGLTYGNSAAAGGNFQTMGGNVNDANITGSLSINDTVGGSDNPRTITLAGYKSTISPTINYSATDLSNATTNIFGGWFTTQPATIIASANPSINIYGIRADAAGSLGTTGTTAHYGGYFSATFSADNNYGVYINSAASATNNYGLYINSVAASATNYAIYSGAAAQSYFAGNLGIGSTAPTAALDVVGDASASGSLVLRGSSTNTIDSLNGGALTFQTSPGGDAGLTERVRIDKNGNIGIGTTDPSSFKLQVAGNIGPNTTDNYDLGSLAKEWNNVYTKSLYLNGSLVNPSGLTNYWQRAAGAVSPANITDDVLVGATATASATVKLPGITNQDALFTLGTGNVGIGTTTTKNKLDVNGNMAIGTYAGVNTAPTNGLIVSGNVGIGTTTTSGGVLSVNGTGTALNLNVASTSDNYMQFNVSNSVKWLLYPAGTSNNDLRLWDTADRFTFQKGGNLGIGSTSPGAMLDVAQNTSVAADTYLTKGTATWNAGTLSNGARVLYNSYGSLSPTATITDTGVGSQTGILGAYGVYQAVDLGGITLGNNSGSGIPRGNIYGGNVQITGNPTLNDTVGTNGEQLTTAGYNADITSTPTITSAITTTLNYMGGRFTSTITSAGNAGVIANVYGVYGASAGNLTTTGNTSHYGGYFSTSGTADNNYGGYFTASGATNNYAIYSASGSNYFSGNVGLGTTNPANFILQSAGNIGPNITNNYDLGSSSLQWNNIYAKNFYQDGTLVNIANYWQRNAGAVSPINITDDLLLGGTATSSAKFAVLNMSGSGTPVASVSAQNVSGQALSFAGDGTIQGAQMNNITLGGNTTGNIFLNPRNSAAGGQVSPVTDNITDLGASSSARFRNLFLGPASLHVQCTTGDGCGQNLDYALGVNTSSNALYIGANGRTGALNQLVSITEGGNVGIGSTDPTDKLAVNGNIQASVFKDYENGSYYLDPSSISTSLIAAGNVGIGTTTPNLGAYTAGSRVATILGSTIQGVMEIGSTATDADATSYGDLSFVNGGTTDAEKRLGVIRGATDGGTANNRGGQLQFYVQNNGADTFTQAMTIRQDGNVGIGTTTAGDKLVVNGNAQASIFKDKENTAYYLDPANATTSLLTAGNVGIGTTTTTAKLEVAGNINANGTIRTIGVDNPSAFGSGTGLELRYTNSEGNILAYNRSGSARVGLGFDASLFHFDTGNVGIGSTAPGYKLDVNGATRTLGSDVFAQSDNTSLDYSHAPIQIREALYGASGSYQAPRLAFHWGGVVASQIALESDGTIAIRNNPGTAYEKFKASALYAGIMYDTDNTGYYVDPNSTSNVYDWRAAGVHVNGYLGLAGSPNFTTIGSGMGTTAGGYGTVGEFDSNCGSNNCRLLINGSRRSTNSDWAGSGFKIAYGVDGSFYDGSKAAIYLGTGGSSYNGAMAFATDGTDRFQITTSGAVVVTSLGTGTVYSNSGTLTNVNPSSMSYKHDIQPWNIDPMKLLNLDLKSFVWNNTGQADYGLIAEEVKANTPDLYSEDPVSGTKGYKLDHVTFYLIGIAKNHEARIASLSAQLSMSTASASAISINGTSDGTYTAQMSDGSFVSAITAFAETVIANLRAGFIDAQKITTQSLALGTENMTIAGQSLKNYILGVVSEANLSRNYTGGSLPELTVQNMKTNLISPLASESAVVVNGRVFIAGNPQSTAPSLEVQGNASISGQLTTDTLTTNKVISQQLEVSSDATISGTLHAGKIIADDIEGLNAKIATLAANTIINNTNIYQTASPSAVIPTQAGIQIPASAGMTNNSASGSGQIDPAFQNGIPTLLSSNIQTEYANIASLSGQFAQANNLQAEFGQFNQGLMSLGPTSLSDTSVMGQLSVGGNMILADNTINVLGADLQIQPLKQGGVSFEGGLIAINTDGDLTVGGSAVFKKDVSVEGTLMAKIISPVPNSDLIIKLPGNEVDGSGSNFVIQNASGSGVLAVDQKGNVTASGSGFFKDVAANIFNIVRGAQADTSVTETVASGSAGTAVIKRFYTERTIYSPYVSDKSLIYVTATSDTMGLTPYIARQTAEDSTTGTKGSFTIQVPSTATKDIKVNWWIVN